MEKLGPCVVITMDLGENRLNSNFCRAMHKALDEAERSYTKLATESQNSMASMSYEVRAIYVMCVWLTSLNEELYCSQRVFTLQL